MGDVELKANLKPLLLMMLTTFVVCLSATFSQVIAVDLVLALSPRDLMDFQWMFPTYLMGACAGMSLCAGTLDRYGRKIPYLVGSGLFIIGTALVAVSHSMDLFLVARIIQGLGSGAVIVVCIAQAYFTIKGPQTRYTTHGILSLGFGTGMLFGIFIGQAVENTIGWREYMWILAAAQLLLAYPCMKVMETGENGVMKADIAGAVSLALAAALIIYIPQKLYMTHFELTPVNIAAILAFVFFLSLFVYFEMRDPESMVHRHLDDRKLMAASLIMIMLLGAIDMAAVGWMVKVSLFAFGLDVLSAWPCFVWVVIGAASTAIPASKLIHKTGHAPWFIAAAVLSPIALFSVHFITTYSTKAELCMHLFLIGLAIGCLVSMLNATIQNRTDKECNGGFTSFALMIRTAALWFGFNLYQIIADMKITDELAPTVEYWNAKLGLSLPTNSTLANLLMTPVASAIKVIPGLVDTIGKTYISGVSIGFMIMSTVFTVIALTVVFCLVRGRKLV